MKPMRMKAIGTINDKKRYYTFVKDSSIEEPLNEIMDKLGFRPMFYGEGDSPSNYENHIQNITSKDFDIDIIYTSNRIILIVQAQKKQQERFKELMLAYSKLEE